MLPLSTPDLFDYDDAGKTALYYACRSGNVTEVDEILAQARKRKVLAQLLVTPVCNERLALGLHIACIHGHTACVKSILRAAQEVGLLRESLTKKNKHGNTAFICACGNGHVDVVNAMLDLAQDAGILAELLLAPADRDGNLGFHAACYCGKTACITSILQRAKTVGLLEKIFCFRQNGNGILLMHKIFCLGNQEVTQAIMPFVRDLPKKSRIFFTHLALICDISATTAITTKKLRVAQHSEQWSASFACEVEKKGMCAGLSTANILLKLVNPDDNLLLNFTEKLNHNSDTTLALSEKKLLQQISRLQQKQGQNIFNHHNRWDIVFCCTVARQYINRYVRDHIHRREPLTITISYLAVTPNNGHEITLQITKEHYMLYDSNHEHGEIKIDRSQLSVGDLFRTIADLSSDAKIKVTILQPNPFAKQQLAFVAEQLKDQKKRAHWALLSPQEFCKKIKKHEAKGEVILTSHPELKKSIAGIEEKEPTISTAPTPRP